MPCFGRSRWIEVRDAESAQHARRTLSAAGYGAFVGAIAEINVHHAHGFERGERLRGGEIKTGGLELLFDRAMEQECQSRDEDMRLHAIIGAVIDRPQIDD